MRFSVPKMWMEAMRRVVCKLFLCCQDEACSSIIRVSSQLGKVWRSAPHKATSHSIAAARRRPLPKIFSG